MRLNIFAMALGLAVCLCVTPAMSDDFIDAIEARSSGDYTTAIKLLKPLAAKGNPYAQVTLGQIYGAGEGVPRDYAESFTWYELAAKQGNSLAQLSLGSIYSEGRGVERNYKVAMSWYRPLAEKGSSIAQYEMGKIFERGYGVPQDYIEAHMWLNLAAADYGVAREDRDKLAEKMTPEQIAEAQRLAREWIASHPTP